MTVSFNPFRNPFTHNLLGVRASAIQRDSRNSLKACHRLPHFTNEESEARARTRLA